MKLASDILDLSKITLNDPNDYRIDTGDKLKLLYAALTQIYPEIKLKNRTWYLESFDTTVSAGQYDIELPVNASGTIGNVYNSLNKTLLRICDIRFIVLSEIGTPTFFCPIGERKIRLFPVPVSEINLNITYLRQPYPIETEESSIDCPIESVDYLRAIFENELRIAITEPTIDVSRKKQSMAISLTNTTTGDRSSTTQGPTMRSSYARKTYSR